jgi:hypothetical protein
MTDNSKGDEARVRRLATAYGYRISKSRQRKHVPNLDNHGDFMLLEAASNYPVLGFKYDASLDEIAQYLTDNEVFAPDRRRGRRYSNGTCCRSQNTRRDRGCL